MRLLLLILALAILAQTVTAQTARTDPFAADWKQVEKLMAEGRPESAFSRIEDILTRARKTNNTGQQLKALYWMGLASQDGEEAAKKQIQRLQQELPSAKGPQKALIHGMLGKAYWDYLQENRWNLQQRTKTNGNNPDIDTWASDELHDEASRQFRLSLLDAIALQAIATRSWQPVVTKGNRQTLRPTLYDLLAHSALDYFTRADKEMARFSRSFEVDDSTAFSPAETFCTQPFPTADSLSHKAIALSILQSLLRLHLKDADPEARIEADVQRLQYMHDIAILDDKDQRYTEALAQLQHRYARHQASAEAGYLRLEAEYRRKEQPNAKGSSLAGRMKLPDIAAACRKIMADHPGSTGARHAEQLLQGMQKRTLSLMAEKVNLPGEPFRLRTSYRNLGIMHYRIIRLPDGRYDSLRSRSGDEFWTSARQLPAFRSATQSLPGSADMHTHSAEVRIDPLPVGRYLILASPEAGFPLQGQPLAAIIVHISRIAWITRDRDAFVLDRETGRPLHDAEVKAWRAEYNYNTHTSSLTQPITLRTDLDGYFRLPDPREHDFNPRRIEVSWKEDRLLLDDNEPFTYSDDRAWTGIRDEYETRYQRLYLFTDRGLYRPGQTVQFKGLMVTRDYETRRPKVVTGFATTIILTDANGEVRDSLQLVTGDYGSFSGSFRMPAQGLTGEFSLEADHGRCTFRVEEYKRPSFEVTWKETEGAMKLLDSSVFRGEARSFTGAPSNNAKVSYRITRVTRFPYPWYARYLGWNPPPPQAVEIAQGETRTAADGSFRIPFLAQPDKSVDRSRLPVFTFEASVDVTDIGGETHSANTTLPLGYHTISLGLRTEPSETYPNDRDLAVELTATQLSGRPRPTTTTLTLKPLQQPQRFLRTRYWPMTDTTVMSEAEYIRAFPFDPYRDEGNRDNWPANSPVFTQTHHLTSGSLQVSIPTKGLSNGWYRLELSATEADGKLVTTRKEILLREVSTGQSDPFGYFSHNLSASVAQPGEAPLLSLSTACNDLWAIELLDGYAGAEVPPTHAPKGKQPKHSAAPANPGHPYRLMGLSKNISISFDLPITEDDRGGFGIGHVFVKHNRFHQHAATLAVPWSNKELDIRFQTWRDKTTPGSREEWTLTVKGPRSEKATAEVLMSMYDASLDAILPFDWEKPELFDSYPLRYDRYMTKEWHAENHFASQGSHDRSYRDKPVVIPEKTPDALLWDNDHIPQPRLMRNAGLGPMSIRIRGKSSVVMAMEKASDSTAPAVPPPVLAESQGVLNETVVVGYGKKKPEAGKSIPVQMRKDFRETAFFLPELRTDSTGGISFRFTMPEALTQWKWQVLAHTRDLSTALAARTVVTRKELMVQPNAPRFLREGDRLTLPVRITNLSDSERVGRARLELFDPSNGQPVDGYFHNMFPEQYFTAPAGQTVAVPFTFTVPADFSRPVAYRIIAEAGSHSDGEEKAMPVLSNRILLTESIPLRVEGLGTRTFRFDKLLQSGASPTLTQHRLTLEYATNPAWYAVKSLPYLTAYPHECVEQSFNRFYANAVAAEAAASSPRIRAWVEGLAADTAKSRKELSSEIGRNPGLRDILLEETPWVLEARGEEQQRRNLAILFDSLRIAQELERAFSKVQSAQNADGGLTWFHGGPSDRYMTQYVLAQMGRMQRTGAVPSTVQEAFGQVSSRGLAYLTAQLGEDFRNDARRKERPSTPSHLQVQALYTLSCYLGEVPTAEATEAARHYRKLTSASWQSLPLQLQAMSALMLHRTGDRATANAILRSLRERAVKDTQLGMYWKDGQNPWYWQDAPIETQSILIEAFLEIASDTSAADRMRLWLLSKKQTERWESTRATADACRALLTGGTDWLAADRTATISLGKTTPLSFNAPGDGTELLATIEPPALRPELGEIRVSMTGNPIKANNGLSWGAAHWQYFEHLDRISAATGPLNVEKKLYRERITEKGPILEEITEAMELRVGDKLTIRLLVRSDRDMEYVHLKDMRASGTEPADVLSEYRWQGSIGYYQSTRDASSHFFIPSLPKGTYVFDYSAFVSHAGRFPAGMATVECMYAPSFRGHSESPILRVLERAD